MRDALKYLVVLIVVAVASGAVYQTYQQARPCAQPISYAIGAVDKRFGITRNAIIAEAKNAANIWNKAAEKTVLVYDPTADLKINLIYDEREANARLGRKILHQQEEEEAARVTLEALQAEYTAMQTAYNQEVSAVNARGGATRKEAATLSAERESLNALADSLNRQVALFNASVAAFNATVEEYNRTTGRTFEAGQYSRDATGERINIFQFTGSVQLRRVLAHEFGHAIGLDHNENPKSIMFSKNESGNLVPTASDLAALRAVCGTGEKGSWYEEVRLIKEEIIRTIKSTWGSSVGQLSLKL